MRGIAQYSHIHGPWAFHVERPGPGFYMEPGFYSKPTKKERALSYPKSWNVDGIITREPKKVQKIIATGLPTIIVIQLEEPIRGLPNIINDNISTGRMAAEHLLDRGFKHFAYCGFNEMFCSRDRYESFSKRVAEMGFETHLYERPQSKIRSFEDEQTIMANWLRSLPKPVGLMTFTDDRSQQVIDACKIVGVNVPDEVAVIGVDNDDLICDLSDPPLSSIAFNTERAGYEAAELLDKLMAGKKVVNQTIVVRPTHVVTRQSTNIIAIEDSVVAEAARFIRQHSRKMLQVNDVASAVMVSRCTLERRFRRALGKSVLKELKRVRTDQITQMLMETNLSVSQIASTLGYLSATHIARYFRQEKGISPLAYRKKYGRK
jgi:LacI family transcriptional regulator